MPRLGSHRLDFLSARYWRGHPARLLSCASAAGLVVAVTLALVVVAARVLAHYQGGGAEAHGADLYVVATPAEGMGADWESVLEAVSGVERAAPSLNRQGIALQGAKQVPVGVRGVKAEDYEAALSAGRPLLPLERGTVLVSSALAEALSLGLDSPFEVVTPKGFRTYFVVGIYPVSGSGPLAYSLIAPLTEVQQSFAGGERLVSAFDVTLAQGAELSEYKVALAERLGGAADVLELSERRAGLGKLLGGSGLLLIVIGLLTFLASAYLLLSNLSLMLLERRGQLLTLITLGLSRAALGRWLGLELLWLNLLGSLVGASLGLVLVGVLENMMQHSLFATPLAHSAAPPGLLLAAGTGVTLALWGAAALFIRRQVARLGLAEPDAAGPATTPQAPLPLRLSGALLALGLLVKLSTPAGPAGLRTGLELLVFFLLLGSLTLVVPSISARLSRLLSRWQGSPAWLWLSAELAQRQRRYSGVAVASLIISLTVLTGVFGVAHSYRSSLKTWVDSMYSWDLVVSQRTLGVQTEVPISEDLRWELAVVPGVSLVSADVWPSIKQGRLNANLYVFDMANFPYKRSFVSLEGVASERLPGALRAGRSVAISKSLAQSQALHVGGGLSLITPTGEYAYDIVAVVDDIGAAANGIFMDRQIYLEDWRNENVDLFTIALEEKANREQVATLIREQLSSRYDLEVKSIDEYRAELDRMVDNTFGLSQVLVLLFVAIAALGLINVGLESLHFLRREFAILKALGADLGLIRTTLLCELVFNGVLGVAAGITLGTLLSNLLVQGVQLGSRFAVVWQLPVTAYGILVLTAIAVVALVGSVTLRSVERLGVLEGMRG